MQTDKRIVEVEFPESLRKDVLCLCTHNVLFLNKKYAKTPKAGVKKEEFMKGAKTLCQIKK